MTGAGESLCRSAVLSKSYLLALKLRLLYSTTVLYAILYTYVQPEKRDLADVHGGGDMTGAGESLYRSAVLCPSRLCLC
jgi:hypothetical protein